MKKILVKVKTGVSRSGVECIDETNYIVRVYEHAHDGHANAAVIKAFATHLGYAPSRLKIKQGLQSKRKIIELT